LANLLYACNVVDAPAPFRDRRHLLGLPAVAR